MGATELLTLVVLVALVVIVIWVLKEVRDRREPQGLGAAEQRLNQRVDTLERQIVSHLQSLDQRLTGSVQGVQQSITTSITNSTETLQKTAERLASIDAAARRIVDELSPAVSSLKGLLQAPALRGGLGESLLSQLLENVIPKEHFAEQYTFRDGGRVDAIIRLPDGILPIDSKFPLAAFERLRACDSDEDRRRLARGLNRDVRSHIDNVAKYIRPAEGTLPFALMYIPSEGVYYEVMVREACFEEGIPLSEYSRERNVFPVSPNTFYCYLEAIAKGLRGLQVEESAREIIQHLESLRREFSHIDEGYRKLGTHLTNAKNKYDEVHRDVDRFAHSLTSSLPKASDIAAEDYSAPDSEGIV